MAAGIPLRSSSGQRHSDSSDTGQYVEGMLVQHDAYGKGRITEVHGYGAMRTIKIRFQAGGERSFRADKAKLTIVRSS